jgi:hypothetical protein
MVKLHIEELKSLFSLYYSEENQGDAIGINGEDEKFIQNFTTGKDCFGGLCLYERII